MLFRSTSPALLGIKSLNFHVPLSIACQHLVHQTNGRISNYSSRLSLTRPPTQHSLCRPLNHLQIRIPQVRLRYIYQSNLTWTHRHVLCDISSLYTTDYMDTTPHHCARTMASWYKGTKRNWKLRDVGMKRSRTTCWIKRSAVRPCSRRVQEGWNNG